MSLDTNSSITSFSLDELFPSSWTSSSNVVALLNLEELLLSSSKIRLILFSDDANILSKCSCSLIDNLDSASYHESKDTYGNGKFNAKLSSIPFKSITNESLSLSDIDT